MHKSLMNESLLDNNTSISVRQVSKLYKLYPQPKDRLKEALHPFGKRYHSEFYALSDVSFDIHKGETVGVLGHNGAGKSTLLKIITGVLTPSAGQVVTRGRISSLLELGAGFNPDYSGLENIYLQGMLLGYEREQVTAKLDAILSFADIGDFVHQAVKMYSSGMFARLAFAVAINVDPDILIVDEALSVGDMAFQEKCILKMKEMLNDNRSILFVSHSLPSIRNFCTKAIWLQDGQLVMQDDAHLVCDAYAAHVKANSQQPAVAKAASKETANKTISLNSISVNGEDFYTGDTIEIKVGFTLHKATTDYAIGILIRDQTGQLVTLFSTTRDDVELTEQFSEVVLSIPDNDLLAGDYSVAVSISDTRVMFAYDSEDQAAGFSIKHKLNRHNLPIAEGMFRCKHHWVLPS